MTTLNERCHYYFGALIGGVAAAHLGSIWWQWLLGCALGFIVSEAGIAALRFVTRRWKIVRATP